jgi:tubulin--tyrosine ligase-like protein 12
MTNPGCLVNQFPFESNLTVKDLLAASIQSHIAPDSSDDLDEWTPPWFPSTYNLHTELLQFIAHFQLRERR